MGPPLKSIVKDQLRTIRALRLRGLDSSRIAVEAGIPLNRVKHLERHYADRPLIGHLTAGLARDVRQAWALGQHRSKAELALAFDLLPEQLAELGRREPPHYLPAEWGAK